MIVYQVIFNVVTSYRLNIKPHELSISCNGISFHVDHKRNHCAEIYSKQCLKPVFEIDVCAMSLVRRDGKRKSVNSRQAGREKTVKSERRIERVCVYV